MIGCLWDLVVMASALAWLVALYLQGLVSIPFAAFALIIIAVLLALGRGLGGNVGRLTRFWFRIGIPGASFLTLAITLTGGYLKDTLKVLGGFGALMIVLGGLYVMIFGAFSSRKRK
jgi:hypothetical protein